MDALTCSVCAWMNDFGTLCCERCGWERVDLDFLRSLTEAEEERYQGRRELVRSRWAELGRYDQSPRLGTFREAMIVEGGGSSSLELAIGGSLL